MKRVYSAVLIAMLVLVVGCQDSNIKNRLKGDVKTTPTTEEKTQKDTSSNKDVTMTFDSTSKETPVDVREGVIIDNDVPQEQTVTVTVNKDDVDNDTDTVKDSEGVIIPDATVMKRIQGFRIQIMSVSNKNTADTVSKQLMERWETAKKGSMSYQYRENIPIYIEYYEPFWKIRVGNYKNKTEAEDQLKNVKRLGYTDAWIVQSMIIVKE